MAAAFLPCANVATRQRGRPGNLVPAGKRLASVTVADGTLLVAPATDIFLLALPTPVTITAPGTEVTV